MQANRLEIRHMQTGTGVRTTGSARLAQRLAPDLLRPCRSSFDPGLRRAEGFTRFVLSRSRGVSREKCSIPVGFNQESCL